MYPPVVEVIVFRRRYMRWYGFSKGSLGGGEGSGDSGLVGRVPGNADDGASGNGLLPGAGDRSVCKVSGME